MANGDGKWVWNLNELDFFLVVMDILVAGKSMWLAGSELGFLEQEPSREAQLVSPTSTSYPTKLWMLYRCAHNLVLCIWLEFSFMQIVKSKSYGKADPYWPRHWQFLGGLSQLGLVPHEKNWLATPVTVNKSLMKCLSRSARTWCPRFEHNSPGCHRLSVVKLYSLVTPSNRIK